MRLRGQNGGGLSPDEGIEWLQAHTRPQKVADRDEFLVSLCRGVSILHVGAVDSGMLTRRMEDRKFLHQRVTEAASACVGVDVDAAGIQRLGELGITNIRHVDVESPGWSVEGGPFDLVLAADIIEHLTCPGNLLEGASRSMGPSSRLVITTPNAYRLENVLLARAGRELIHPQHSALYSPATLRAALTRHGFQVHSMFVYPGKGKATFRSGEAWTRRMGKLAYATLDAAAAFLLRSRSTYLADGLGVIATRRAG